MIKRICAVMAAVMLCGNAFGQAAQKSTVLVVPVKYAMVDLALDVAWIKPVSLVSYETRAGELVVYSWDAEARQWNQATVADYAGGKLFATPVDQAIVVGTDEANVAKLAKDATWAAAQKTVPTIDVKDVVNTLNENIAFTADEWKWLAGRHGLTLRDLNEERRATGKYGSRAPAVTPADVQVPAADAKPAVATDTAPAAEAAAPAAAPETKTVIPPPEDKAPAKPAKVDPKDK